VAFLLLLAAAVAPAASGADRVVRVATLNADIDPVTANYVIGQIHAAEDQHAAAFVLELDTPGGLSTSMDSIVSAELASPIPIVVWIAPAGARGASAGFFILQGSDIAAMVPVSNTGSATPINSSGSNLSSDLRGKAINDARAKVHALAEQHGRNGELAEKAVEPKSASCPNCPMNWTATQAHRQNIIDVVAPTLQSLLRQIDGMHLTFKHQTVDVSGARVETHQMSFQDRLLDVLIDPNLIVLLFLGGLAGIAFELTHPGIVLPGLLGVVSFILALLGLSVIPFSWTGVALILVGIVLLGLEAHVQAHGAFAAVGVLALALGAIIVFRVNGAPGASTPLVLAITLSLAAFVLVVVRKSMLARRLPVTTGIAELVGATAVVRTPLTPRGQVFLHGERWAAVTDDEQPIERGQTVQVVSVDGLLLHVAPERNGQTGEKPTLVEGA
jgi:membrane-bound serine protease (ClpP class)